LQRDPRSLYAGADMFTGSPCGINFPNICDISKKLFSEIRKCVSFRIQIIIVILLDTLPSQTNMQYISRPMPAVKVCEKWDVTHPYACIDTLSCSPCSLNFPNLCDNFVKKFVFQIRKCRPLQGPSPRPLTRGFASETHWGLRPQTFITYFASHKLKLWIRPWAELGFLIHVCAIQGVSTLVWIHARRWAIESRLLIRSFVY